jgi:hypothetical protein
VQTGGWLAQPRANPIAHLFPSLEPPPPPSYHQLQVEEGQATDITHEREVRVRVLEATQHVEAIRFEEEEG